MHREFPLALFVAALASLFLAVYAATRKDIRGSIPLTVLYLAAAVYAMLYMAELLTREQASLAGILLMEYVAIPVIPSAWLVFSAEFSSKRAAPRGLVVLTMLVPAVTFAVVATNPLHHLYFSNVAVDATGRFARLATTKGPLYWYSVAYSWGSVAASLVIMARSSGRFGRMHRRQSLAIVGITALALAVFAALYAFGFPRTGFSYAPVVFLSAIIVLGMAFFSLGDLRLAPLTRDSLMEAISEGIVSVDARGTLIDANAAALSILGLTPAAFSEKATSVLPAWFAEASGRGDEVTAPDGTRYRVSRSALPSRGTSPRGEVFIILDITETSILNDTLRALAGTDELTRLINRRRFLDIANREYETSRRKRRSIAFAMADIDDFKAVNDTHGHAAGDEVLKAVAESLASSFRELDLVCRWGGEEFLMALPEIGEAEAEAAAERARAAVAGLAIPAGGTELRVTVSVGVFATVPTAESTLDKAIDAADRALYLAKRAGKNRVTPLPPEPAPRGPSA